MAGLSEGAADGQGRVVSMMRRIGDATLRAWDSTVAAADNIGVAIMDGIIAGIESKREELIAKMEEIAREAYQRAMNSINAASPSKLFMNMGYAIIDGVVAGLNAQEDKLYDKLIDIAGRLQQIGEGMFTFQADALTVNIEDADEQLQESLDALRHTYGDIVVDNLLAMNPAERAYFLRSLRGTTAYQNPLLAQQVEQAVVLADRRNALEQEYVRQQEELAKLEEQRARLNFLQMQVDLLQLIRDNGLSTDILDGLTLGLDANITDVIAAMTEAVRQLIEKTNDELESASPSGVFRRIGGQIMAGLAEGIIQTREAQLKMRQAMATVVDQGMADIGRLDTRVRANLSRQTVRLDTGGLNPAQTIYIYGGYNPTLSGTQGAADPLTALYWNSR